MVINMINTRIYQGSLNSQKDVICDPSSQGESRLRKKEGSYLQQQRSMRKSANHKPTHAEKVVW